MVKGVSSSAGGRANFKANDPKIAPRVCAHAVRRVSIGESRVCVDIYIYICICICICICIYIYIYIYIYAWIHAREHCFRIKIDTLRNTKLSNVLFLCARVLVFVGKRNSAFIVRGMRKYIGKFNIGTCIRMCALGILLFISMNT